MLLFENSLVSSKKAETDVISCRLSLETKMKMAELCRQENVAVSNVLKDFVEETVSRGSPYWWVRSKKRQRLMTAASAPRRQGKSAAADDAQAEAPAAAAEVLDTGTANSSQPEGGAAAEKLKD